MVLQYLSIHAEKTAAKAWMAAADMEMAKMREEEKAAADTLKGESAHKERRMRLRTQAPLSVCRRVGLLGISSSVWLWL